MENKGECSPIFYNKNKFIVLSRNTFWLSPTPEKVSVGWDASMEDLYMACLKILNQKKILGF